MNTASPIAIVAAITPELAELRAAMTMKCESTMAGRYHATGQLEGRSVILAEGGIGKVNAAITAATLVERHRCRLLIFTGVAGGLDPELSVGDVVIADRTIQYDTGVATDNGLERYQPGHVPFFNPTDRFGYQAAPATIATIRSHLEGFTLSSLSSQAGGSGRDPRIVFGTILTGDQFINSESVRDQLHSELGGAAVEMEGAALAQTAEALGVDHLVIRSLSDVAGAGSIKDFTKFLDEVAANSVRVVRHLLAVL